MCPLRLQTSQLCARAPTCRQSDISDPVIRDLVVSRDALGVRVRHSKHRGTARPVRAAREKEGEPVRDSTARVCSHAAGPQSGMRLRTSGSADYHQYTRSITMPIPRAIGLVHEEDQGERWQQSWYWWRSVSPPCFLCHTALYAPCIQAFVPGRRRPRTLYPEAASPVRPPTAMAPRRWSRSAR